MAHNVELVSPRVVGNGTCESLLWLLPAPVLLFALFAAPLPAQGLNFVHSPINGHFYAVTTPMTWAQAEFLAVQAGGHLATVRNAQENQWLEQTFGPTEFYVGYNDRAVEGQWVWSSGESNTFSNWNPGEPNNLGDEDSCIIEPAWSGRWNDGSESGPGRGVIEVVIGPTAPVTATSLSMANPPAAVTDHALAPLPNGGALLFGGNTAVGPQPFTYTLLGTNWTAQFPASSPAFRIEHSLLLDPVHQNNLLFGGKNPLGTPLGDTWTWANNQWTSVATTSAPSPRFGHKMAFEPNGSRCLLFGGEDAAGVSRGDFWAWDGSAWTQLTPSVLPAARSHFGMDWDAYRGRLVLYGGKSGSTSLDDLWEWDGTNWTEASVVLHPPNSGEVMTWDSNRQRLVMFGGSSPSGAVQDGTWELARSASPASQQSYWSQVATAVAPGARNSHAMAFDAARGQTVLFGGLQVANTTYFGDTWVYDGAAWTRINPANAPSARWSSRAVYDSARAKVVLFGGYNPANNQQNDTWEWNGANWIQLMTANAPSPRLTMGMAYDSARQRVVLFGGQSSTSVLGDTWEFDGVDWSLVANSGPAARRGAAMAYDPIRGRVVLFGGGDFSTAFGDTWVWNGSVWSQLTTGSAPSSRLSHMEFDSQRGRVVLFGGSNHNFTTGFGDTWEWDGTDWAPVDLQRGDGSWNPGPRDRFALAYDPRGERIVVHGGETANGCSSEFWSWDGADWSMNLPIATAPSARSGHTIWSDAATDELLLFGGRCAGAYNNDLWGLSLPVYTRWNGYGTGCAGLIGVPSLAVRTGHDALIGQTLLLDLTNVPSTPFNLAFGVFDLQRDTFMGLPIPVDLAAFGLPSCQAWTGSYWSFALPAMQPGVGTSMSVPLPNWSALLGMSLYLQALVFDNANGRWASLSNGVASRIGDR